MRLGKCEQGRAVTPRPLHGNIGRRLVDRHRVAAYIVLEMRNSIKPGQDPGPKWIPNYSDVAAPIIQQAFVGRVTRRADDHTRIPAAQTQQPDFEKNIRLGGKMAYPSKY
jgi:hypothetical protein